MQWVTAVEDCEGVSVQLYDGWRVDYAAGWRKLPHVGVLHFAWAALEAASAVQRRHTSACNL
jgi:hypothetical protein